MLAVVVIFSILCGAAGVAVVQMLDLPFWASFLAYSLAGSFGLLGAAFIASTDVLRPSRNRALREVPANTLRHPQ